MLCRRIVCSFSNNARKVSSFPTPSPSECKYLTRKNGNKIAYRQVVSGNPDAIGVLFFSGFQSNMQSTKSVAIERYCIANNLPYVRFDYQGCGDSTGELREMTLKEWRGDALAVLDELTAGPQVIVGSSMGGLIMLHSALARPNRVRALIGISTAADMPERMFSNYPGNVLEMVMSEGECLYSTGRHDYLFTKKFFEDLPNHSVLNRASLPIKCTVRLLHGLCDDKVPVSVPLELASKLQTRNLNLHIRKNAEHRFCQTEDIQLLFEVLDCMVHGTESVKALAIRSFEAFTRYNHVKEGDVLTRTIATRR